MYPDLATKVEAEVDKFVTAEFIWEVYVSRHVVLGESVFPFNKVSNVSHFKRRVEQRLHTLYYPDEGSETDVEAYTGNYTGIISFRNTSNAPPLRNTDPPISDELPLYTAPLNLTNSNDFFENKIVYTTSVLEIIEMLH